jgi:hypothetical protein
LAAGGVCPAGPGRRLPRLSGLRAAVRTGLGVMILALGLAAAVAQSVHTSALVLVNSQSPRFADFQRFLQPYLENFGVPYAVVDISSNLAAADFARYAVIVVGHSQLDTNKVYLTGAVQTNLSLAVAGGTGLVSFDNALSESNLAARYRYVEDIFGFTYSSAAANNTLTYPATEAGSQMHYLTARHTAGETIALHANLTLPGLSAPADADAVAWCGTKALVIARQYGQGRAVQWASYDWMSTTVLGPLEGVDDLVWRSLVWAARKPFILRGLPNLLVMRMDDVSGPFWWVHTANEIGFKPWLSIFLSKVSPTNVADLRLLVTNGNATTSIHSFDCCSTFFYWNHSTGPWPDNVMSNYYSIGTQWHATNGIPISKVVGTHYSEMGLNAFAGLKAWGVEYFPIEVAPGTEEYLSPPAPWLVGGPYRLYETPQAGNTHWPLWYAHFLTVPGHPEFDGQFFNCYVEVRDDSGGCGEWCPSNNDLAGSIGRGTRQAKREMDSMALGQLYTHEWYLIPIPNSANQVPMGSNNWRTILMGITNNLAAYNPRYVTLDYACQYVRATRTSRLAGSDFDPASGQVTLTFTGKADLDTQVYVFLGSDSAITNSFGGIPAFVGGSTNTFPAVLVPPAVLNPPGSETKAAGSTAVLTVVAGGTPPLSYQWYKSAGGTLSNSVRLSTPDAPTLVLSNVLGTDSGFYTVVLSNAAGTVTSAPLANLTVLDPILTAQPRSRTNHAGTPALFSVGAYGTTPSYQWYRDQTLLDAATGASLTLPAVSATAAGAYSARVSNAFGLQTSAPALLTVVPALQVNSLGITAGVATVKWGAIAGQTYSLLFNTNLNFPNWIPLAPSITAADWTASATNALSGPGQGFYRLQLGP